jgi:hypothetical protein
MVQHHPSIIAGRDAQLFATAGACGRFRFAARCERLGGRPARDRMGRGASAPPGPSSPGALHRHSVGALTSRAAFPVTASAFAIACLRHSPCPSGRRPSGSRSLGTSFGCARMETLVSRGAREARSAAIVERGPGSTTLRGSQREADRDRAPIATSHGSPYPRKPVLRHPPAAAEGEDLALTEHEDWAGRGVASRGTQARGSRAALAAAQHRCLRALPRRA